MGRDLGSIYHDLIVIKTKELQTCNQELTKENHSPIVQKALLAFKHELLESLEMYDRYLDNNKENDQFKQKTPVI
jgi:hypothetical protein